MCVLDKQQPKVTLAFFGMFPKECDEIFSSFKINEEYLFENVGLKLFFVSEIRLVSDSPLSDNQTIGCHLLECLILRF